MINFAEFKTKVKTGISSDSASALSFANFKTKPKVETPKITQPIDIRKEPNFSDFKFQTSTSPFLSPNTPTIQGVVGTFAKEAGQSTMRNIASFIGSEALESVVKPVTKKVSELEKGSLNFQFFTEDLAKRLYGDVEDLTSVEITGESRAEQLAPIGDRIVGLEKRLDEKKKEYDEILKTPGLLPNEKLVLEGLSNLIGKQKGGLSTILIGGMVGLDVVPGFGSADNFLKTLVKEGTELGAERTLLKLGVSEDLAKFYAPDVVKVKNTKEAQTLYEAIVKAQTSTKPTLGIKPFTTKATVDNSLLSEARKYKSAEEFVNTQGKPIYHGSSEVISGDFRTPLYLSENKAYADTYQHTGASSMGRVKKGGGEKTYEFYKAPKERILDVRNPEHMALMEDYFANESVSGAFYPSKRGLVDWTDAEGISQYVEDKKLPFDALLIDEGGIPDPFSNKTIDRGIGYVALNKNGIKTKSQLTDIWNKTQVEIPKETPKIPKPTTEANPPTIASIKELGKRVDSLAGKSKEVIKQEISELEERLSFFKEGLDEMPGKKLEKFIDKKEGSFLDFKNPDLVKTAKERQLIIEQNKKIMRASESAFEGTQYTDMFDDPDTIREAIDKYQETRNKAETIQQNITNLRKEGALITKAKVASGIGMRQRRTQYRAVQARYDLTDSELKKFLHGRNISSMENDEWSSFLKEAEIYGEKTELHRDAMIQLKGTIEHKELKNWDNLRQALNLPPIHQMDTEQIKNLENILDQYKSGDDFLPVRMIETLPNTELAGIKTTREVLEVLSKKSGKAVENMPIQPSEWHRMLGDRRLAQQHPFLEVLVERKNRGLMQAEARTIELSDEIDGLVKNARTSREKGVLDKAIPSDDNIIRWLEADEAGKTALAKEMTTEELKASKRMDEVFKSYYEYLIKRHADKKFSRFEGQYFPHVRRGFLEAWKDDGVLSAFKEMKAKYEQDAFTMNILNEQTQEILPYEKWIGFSQFRSGGLVPTKNAAKAFDAYVTALEKAKHLDEMIPEMMAYVHTLSPRNLSEGGIELDTSLKKFVKEYINANKGRVPKGFFNPGGSFDAMNRGLISLTRMLDLGFNFTTQIAAPIGENLMTLTMLKPKAYAQALVRSQSQQGKAILNKYKEFVGRTPWDSATRASSDIGDKLMSGAFAIYGQATKQANGMFLLGKLTDEELKTGVVSAQRLAQLKVEMSKYRSVRGLESILGRTTEAETLKQYKSWAIPPLTATVENARELASIVRRDGVVKALSSEAGKELFYSVGIGSAIGLMTYTKYRELKDKGGDRSFMEDVAFKAMRDSVSIYGAFDPTLWSKVRVADFLDDMATASLDLIKMEEYKTTGKLKGVQEFKETLTPSIVKRVIPDEEDATGIKGKLQKLRDKDKTNVRSKLQDLRKSSGSVRDKLQELRKQGS